MIKVMCMREQKENACAEIALILARAALFIVLTKLTIMALLWVRYGNEFKAMIDISRGGG